ncbi:ParB/RepB/Spo0J family partition protein [Rhodococcoides yunnanense]|uniref:ParB/RepB/Spo0J family partition protein n=1 Tax=Rhodococcoides yunnanense TaxID=278209 RepID=UPI0022B1485D|nr:ParB/RepB/Spo0J family partition protein [Rhodococcus yunnanensis]MCZ4277448.1 ParB/RepB/Spo0J family partition protein [Rhodococcus yunnanensis]
MTAQNTETITAATEAPAVDTTSTTGAGEEFARLAPNTLEVGPNVRDEVDTDAPAFRALVDSITEHGVIQAISAIRDGENVVVIDGQQRVLASLQAGVETVPVVIRSVTGNAKAREIARLSQQVVANDRRIDLTGGQRAKAVTGMLELGVSATKISKAVQMPRDQVKTAAAAARSQTALDALDGGQLDLEQAAVLAVFDAEGDHDAVCELLEVHRYHFAHTAKRLLADRAERKERATAAQPYAERGFTVSDTEPYFAEGQFRADDLVVVPAEGEYGDGRAITDEVIDANPAAWSVWLSKGERFTLTATGEIIGEESIDWGTEDAPEAKAATGYHHHKDITTEQVWEAEYFTADPAAAGVQPGPILAAALAEADADAAEVDPDDAAAVARAREQKRLAAEAAHKEEQRAALRRTKELNKASVIATEVRIEWLTKFLTRKTLPKGAGKWITDTLVDEPGLLTQNKAPQFLAQLLGVNVPAVTGPTAGYPGTEDRAAREAIAPVIDKASEARAQVIALAQVLAAYEARMSGTGKDWWKRSGFGNQDNYLGFLDQHGHTLAPVEKVASGELTPEQGYDALTAPTGDSPQPGEEE